MKAFPIAVTIASITVLVGSAFLIRAKRQYDADGQAITKLLAEYKAMGVPTNGDEFFHKIPDVENAWVDIGPLLLNKNGKGNGPLYRSPGIAGAIVATMTAKDLSLIKKYLANNQSRRDQIAAALRKKPKIQVPHDYDEGYAMLLPEFATMKSVSRDFCLEGYAAGLQGDINGFRKSLDYANRFANSCSERGELIGSLVGIAIHRQMMSAAFRLAEVRPDLQSQIKEYITKPGLMKESDPRKLLECEFMVQLVSLRYFDSPLVDRQPWPPPLDKVFKLPEPEEIDKAGKPHKGDYMPNSHVLRSFLRNRLGVWKPLLIELTAQKELETIPSREVFDPAFNISNQLPPTLKILDVVTSDEDIYEGFNMDRQINDVNQIIWKALEAKRKTGNYPRSLSDIGIKIRSWTGESGFNYRADSQGITISSERTTTIEGVTKPLIRLSFPTSLVRDPQLAASDMKQISDYKAGKFDQMFSPPKGKPANAP